MKRLPLCLLLFAAFGVYAPATAQIADTTSAWRYLALEVGNVWEYERWEDMCAPEPPFCEPEPNGFLRRRVVEETLLGDTTFFVVEDAYFSGTRTRTRSSEVLVRFDTTEARAYEHRLGGELRYEWPEGLPCPLNLPFEGEWDKCEGYAELNTYDVLGQEMTSKRFSTIYGSYTFVADVGLLGVYLGKFSASGYDLTYARIGGVEYGDEQFPVASESTLVPSTLALAVYPNPARDAATLSLTLDRSQQTRLSVYDVLGRRVLSEDLGALWAGERTHRLDLAGLQPGVYLVRMTGDAGARATTRLVVQ